ncbi:MAG: glycoside hydrolase family 15 protein [Methylocystis sp.]|uniref:glycoside hydrolase family 15 protein n=1 Tax=Methylocystis sp. TaxID=1911079 RepID=UPI003D105D31
MGGVAWGAPGLAPTWSSSDKDFVTTAHGAARLWATVGHGIINEVYWPSTGQPQLRDLGFYLLGENSWADLKRINRYRLSRPKPYVPLLTIAHSGDDYRLTLELLPDPRRDVLLIRFDVEGPYRLAIVAAPHLGENGIDNSAWVEDGALVATAAGASLCVAADAPMVDLSVGYVGATDGWQDLARHGRLTFDFSAAPHGNVAMSGSFADAKGVIALGFAPGVNGARTLALSALSEGYEPIKNEFLDGWQRWGSRLDLPAPDAGLGEEALISATVLKCHEDRMFPGAVVASMSTPWGNHTDTLGGYHLVWTRDATLAAFALIAAGQIEDARRILAHMIAVQMQDGRWPQNYFPSGRPFWTGFQLDETGFPILLAAKLRESGRQDLPGVGEMARRAAGAMAKWGPSSEQDRWEENPGISAFTLAVVIAALVAAAPWLDDSERDYALDLADDWNERIEHWCYVSGAPMAIRTGVAGYYVRLAPPEKDGGLTGRVQLRNREGETIDASALVALDFSWLARLGLRAGTDSRILDTIKVVDAVLKTETPAGAAYRRYNDDGYGEYDDGRPYDGNGVGRAWPLLAGERGHLALAAGEDPIEYLRTISRSASSGGLLPEQIWDAPPIPERGLFPGRPTGGAMPLVWAHAEFLKLLIARQQKRPVERLACVEQRYGAGARRARRTRWRNETPVASLEKGRTLLIEDRRPFTLHIGWDGWSDVEDMESEPLPFDLWGVAIDPDRYQGRARLDFTRRYGERWEGRDHCVEFVDGPQAHTLVHRETRKP